MALVVDGLSAYSFGLWSADGYWWSSSIGLTNTEPELIRRFGRFLLERFEPARLRLRVYVVDPGTLDDTVISLAAKVSMVRPHKMRLNAYQLYVNSRPLLRDFQALRSCPDLHMPAHLLGPYFSGRLDGDGVLGSTPRICYSTYSDAERDRLKLDEAKVRDTSIYRYESASEYCIYIKKASMGAFRALLTPWSVKLARSISVRIP